MKKPFNIVIIILILLIIGFLGYYLYSSFESNVFSRLNFMNKQQDPEIAFVDVKKVYENHPGKKEAERKLENMTRELESKLNEELEDLPGTEQQNLLDKYQRELSKKEDKLLDKIMQNINDIINKIAAEKEVRLVLNKKNVVFGGYDLTEEVIQYIENNVNSEQVLDMEELNLEIDLLQE